MERTAATTRLAANGAAPQANTTHIVFSLPGQLYCSAGKPGARGDARRWYPVGTKGPNSATPSSSPPVQEVREATRVLRPANPPSPCRVHLPAPRTTRKRDSRCRARWGSLAWMASTALARPPAHVFCQRFFVVLASSSPFAVGSSWSRCLSRPRSPAKRPTHPRVARMLPWKRP